MAKHGRRKFRRYLRGAIDHRLDLGTLAAGVVIGSNLADTLEESAFVSSVNCAYSIDQLASGADIGPILFGWAHSDYTDAEIEAWVENSGAWSQGDKVAQEIARRKIKQVGVFRQATSTNTWGLFNDGVTSSKKLGWLLISGQTLKFWCYNMGNVDVGAPDPNVRAQGHANVWPK